MILNEETIERFFKLIESSNNIVLLSHFNPDGDALGSTVGLYKFLKEFGKENLCIIYPNEYPENFSFLYEGVNHIIASNGLINAKQAIKEADLLIYMDLNKLSRTSEELEQYLQEQTAPTVLIDHHINPDKFDVVFSEEEASSTCELTYKIIKRIDASKLNKAIGEALYAGLCTDTGSFSYSCSRRDCFDIAADLVELGVEVAPLKRQIFDLSSESRLKLLGYLLSEKLRVFPEFRTAYISVSSKELRQFNFKKGDLEGVVNYCLKIEGVEFAALISERQDSIRLSFRSLTPTIDVNKFANKYWNGGGHQLAAGGTSKESLETVIERFENQVKSKLYETID